MSFQKHILKYLIQKMSTKIKQFFEERVKKKLIQNFVV